MQLKIFTRIQQRFVPLVAVCFTCSHLVGNRLAGQELIRDTLFEKGITLWRPEPGKHVTYGELTGVQQGTKPIWGLAQWNSRFPLDPTTVKQEGNARIWTNPGKSVTLNPKEGLTLAANSWEEYGTKARERSDPWVHLLVEQRMAPIVYLTDMQSLSFQLEGRLLHCQNRHGDEYEPKRHAAQFQIFFSLQNRNRDSAGYGDYLWLGIPLFDNRHPFPRAHRAKEYRGAGKYIYSLSGDTLAKDRFTEGKWVRVEGDILPMMREALTDAWAKGFLSDSKDEADYALGGMNMGWELPGTFDVAFQVRNLSLRARTEK